MRRLSFYVKFAFSHKRTLISAQTEKRFLHSFLSHLAAVLYFARGFKAKLSGLETFANQRCLIVGHIKLVGHIPSQNRRFPVAFKGTVQNFSKQRARVIEFVKPG